VCLVGKKINLWCPEIHYDLNVQTTMGSIHAQGAPDMFCPTIHDADISHSGDFGDWSGYACHRIACKTGTDRAEQAFENVAKFSSTIFT